MRVSWLAIRADLTAGRSLVLRIGSFLLPLGVWCAISYVPWLWHPLVKVTDAGGSSFLQPGMAVERELFAQENEKLAAAGKGLASGMRANPFFLPAPHEVARAFYTSFTTEPQRRGDPWLHQSLGHSLKVIAAGFALAAAIGAPLGILCGTFASCSRLIEPFVDFIRYMPPPVFGALMIAVLGIDDGPKIAIIFIGTVFQLIRVVANTTRLLDPALLEAAQTLGANRRRLITRVILPGILPNLYNDLRILLGCAWTLLTVAELIGATTGISYFINQQGKYRHYDNVFAGIVMIGLLGLVVDKALCVIGAKLFPWQGKASAGMWTEAWAMLTCIPRRAARPVAATPMGRADAAAA
jgi:NitT/TauT family transport system permease protein